MGSAVHVGQAPSDPHIDTLQMDGFAQRSRGPLPAPASQSGFPTSQHSMKVRGSTA